MAKTIGVALIARNAEQTLGICLESIRPYVTQIVVGVDETSTDNTAQVARDAGADLVFPIAVSEIHECPKHGKVMAQHFANARNTVFGRLDPDLDFFMWLDADDVVKNPELLQALAEEISATDAIGAWFPYHYATLHGGVTNTVFHRERLLKTKDQNGNPITWVWTHRVHENVVPHSITPPQWILRDQPAVYHQEHGHDTKASVERNILLLEIDLEENPQDSRAMFYLGNQYFAGGDMRSAIGYYEMLEGLTNNPYELWQSFCYCSLAYERISDLSNATRMAFRAIDINPRHPEPYYRLASIALLEGKLELVEFWTKQASTTEAPPPKEMPPFFVFKNPLDYTFNSKMPLADALAGQGRVKEARALLEEAYKVLPEERVKNAIEHYKALEIGEEKANGFIRLTETQNDATVIQFWESLNLDFTTRQFGRLRGKVMPAYLRKRRGLTPRIIFYCGRSHEEWSPLSLTTTGIGGSEVAVVEIAQRFRNAGWNVDVYNGAGRYEGIYDGVGYWEAERLTKQDHCDVFVSWRFPKAYELAANADAAILWLHDLNYGEAATADLKAWNATSRTVICGVSQWHADYLKRVYELERTDFLPNGINLDRFPHFKTKERPEKKPFQCVYASSPDRGLERLLRFWPTILYREPGATLQVAYGWDNIDKLIAAGHRNLLDTKNEMIALSRVNPDVEQSITWRGRLSQDALAQLYIESSAWAYPTSFLETACISAMEAMAAGTIPVTSTAGALKDTIGDAGFLIPGLPDTKVWQELWLDVLLGALSSPQLSIPKIIKGMQRVQDMTWDASYTKWDRVVSTLLENKAVAAHETNN